MVVHAVMPVHNNLAYTKQSLTALGRSTFSSLSILLVDDGSTDGTAEVVGRDFPQVEVLRGDGSLWWAGAMSLAVEAVLSRAGPGDYLFSLNNDTRFEPDLLEKLVRASQLNSRAIVACACHNARDGQPLDVGGRFDWARARRIYSSEIVLKSQLPCVDGFDFLTSRGVLYPVEVFRRVGNFRADVLPHYHADMELSFRARQRGFRLFVCTEAVLNVYVDPETSGVHHSGHPEPVSLGQAWEILSSRKSCFEPTQMFRCIDLCCPREHRLKNKLSYLLAALSHSFGRTRWGASLIGLRKSLSTVEHTTLCRLLKNFRIEA